MFKAIIREIKDHWVSLLVYCVTTVGFLALYMALYPTIKDSMASFQKIYESYPKELYQAMGIENLDISNLTNYLSIEYFSFLWPILAIFFAVSRAGTTIAAEIEKGIMGFYLMLPISRVKLFIAKYTGSLIGCAIFAVVSVMVIWPLAGIFDNPIDLNKICLLTILSFLFMWAIFATAMFFSALFSDRGKVYMIMGGLLLISYVIKIIASLQKNWNWLENYSVFHYYNAQEILAKTSLPLDAVLVFSGITIFFSILGLVVFKRRDISV